MPRRSAIEAGVIERLTPEVVLAWVSPELLELARADIERGRVSRPAIRTRTIEAVVGDEKRGPVRVAIGWGTRGPQSRCECGEAPGPCRHAAALAVLLIGAVLVDGAEEPAELSEDVMSTSGAEVERRRREERGATELFTISPHPAADVYGAYDVASPSARTYEVVLRALDAAHNGCTCPDLETNRLGTCKHIEATLHWLRKNAPRRYARAAKTGFPSSYLHLQHEGDQPEVGLRMIPGAPPPVRRFAARHLSTGRLAASLVDAWSDLQRDALEAGVEIPREVAAHAERLRDAAERQRRRHEIEEEVRRGGREQPGFHATLYPYQVDGVAFLAARGRALLADEMGLGKTAQAIAAMTRLQRKGEVRRTVIICPASLKHQWQREIERFTGMGSERVTVVSGPREERRARYGSPWEVLITSYELARTDERDLAAIAPDLLILDEAQRIRNWRTRTSTVVKRIPSRRVFVLTGTPLENRLDDLYSLMQVIDPHLLGPLWRFNEEFSTLDERGKVVGYRRLDRLREILRPVMLRRRKEEVLADLPPQIVSRLAVPMTAEQQAIHEDAESQVVRLMAILRRRPLTPVEEKRLMSAFQRARMACDAAGLVDETIEGAPKLEELAGLLEEICIEDGRKVVVFSEWEKMQRLAAAVCDRVGLEYVRLHGGVPSEARGALIDRFHRDPRCKVFLSTDAGGVGLNLQAATYLINLDLPWNPAVLAQRIARVHRIGQKGAVNVVLMVSEGSMEERIEGTLQAKRALFAAAVGDDLTTTEMNRTTLASRIATLLGDSFAAATGKLPAAEDPQPDPLAAVRARFGDALEQVVRLRDGRLLGVVRGELPPTVEGAPPALLLPSSAAAAMAALGDASPLAGGEVVFQASAPAVEDPRRIVRRERLATGERKLAAARALVGAELPHEALALLHAALAHACRALDESGDPGDDPAALVAAVYGRLIPTGALQAAQAAALFRAGELARAFAGAAAAPPAALVEEVLGEARDLLGHARERLNRPS